MHGFIAVACGAFGAHALKARLDATSLGVWETGARYEIYHALALVVLGVLAPRLGPGLASTAGWGFFLGTCLFSFSLYALALSGVKILGAITPLGGLGMLLGWVCMAWAAMALGPGQP